MQYNKNTNTSKAKNEEQKGNASQRGNLGSMEKQYRRQDVMENFRMRILRNLDIAIEIALQEGCLVIKKYDDLKFYLDNIAYGRIETFKADQRAKKLEKDRQAKRAKRNEKMKKKDN